MESIWSLKICETQYIHTHGVVSVTVNFYSALETQSLNSNVQFLGLLKKMFLYAQDGNGDDEHEA